jgi:hypothetical protein
VATPTSLLSAEGRRRACFSRVRALVGLGRRPRARLGRGPRVRQHAIGPRAAPASVEEQQRAPHCPLPCDSTLRPRAARSLARCSFRLRLSGKPVHKAADQSVVGQKCSTPGRCPVRVGACQQTPIPAASSHRCERNRFLPISRQPRLRGAVGSESCAPLLLPRYGSRSSGTRGRRSRPLAAHVGPRRLERAAG